MQFPDALLRDSVPIYSKLKQALSEKGGMGVELYVLADTSYGRQGRLSPCIVCFLYLNEISFLSSIAPSAGRVEISFGP